jgi:hypothetical protein
VLTEAVAKVRPPTDCGGPQISYKVVAADGAGTKIGLARLESPAVVENSKDQYGNVSLVCTFSYTISTTVDSAVYTVDLVEDDTNTVDEKILSRNDVASNTPVDLSVVFMA